MSTLERLEPIDIAQLSKADLLQLLQVKGEAQQQLFEQARTVRQAAQADRVLLRGVIEVSNYCQKNCDYCAMRATNPGLDRYRMNAEQILAVASAIEQANLSVIFLQGGQDPQGDAMLAEVIPELKRRFNLSILLCLGERPRDVYFKFAELGADSYILKFETSDPQLYRQIAHTPLSRRLQCIEWLREAGFKVGTGNIVGLPGQTLETLAEDILLAIKIRPNFVSASPFIPNQNTPLENLPYGNLDLTLNAMAIYRLAFPTAFIPTVSALEKIQVGGQLRGLNAGANIMTTNFTPARYRGQYKIYSEQRFIVSLAHVRRTIELAGLQSLTPGSYSSESRAF